MQTVYESIVLSIKAINLQAPARLTKRWQARIQFETANKSIEIERRRASRVVALSGEPLHSAALPCLSSARSFAALQFFDLI